MAKKHWSDYPDGFNINYEMLVDEKVKALKAVLHHWGNILKTAMKEAVEDDRYTGQLFNSFHFRVDPQRTRDINGIVRLLVGVLDKDSPVLKYIKFYVYGTKKHFVPISYHGKSTGILKWAQYRGIARRRGNVWIWAKGVNAGKRFTGIVAGNTANNFFERVYNRYYQKIQRDIRQILEGVE